MLQDFDFKIVHKRYVKHRMLVHIVITMLAQ
jgi:hypothetical protein